MKSIGLRLIVAALAVLLGSAISRSQTADAVAAPPMHGHRFGFAGREMGMRFFVKHLNLSDAQQTQMKAILQKERPALRPLFQQLGQTEAQLKQYEEGAYDETKVRALATQAAQTQAELKVQQTRIHSELFQVLTPDQQTQLKELEAQHAERMQQRMHSAPPTPEQ
jgi:periplasmic protein CpxP/Spy